MITSTNNFFKSYFDYQAQDKYRLARRVSYGLLVIPALFGVLYGITFLIGRVTRTPPQTQATEKTDLVAQQQLGGRAVGEQEEKEMKAADEAIPHVTFKDTPDPDARELSIQFSLPPSDLPEEERPAPFDFKIRWSNLLDSNAQVIVNAANNHLGGGDGIDKAIRLAGGEPYIQATEELQKQYSQQVGDRTIVNYPSGHAAMLDSGNIKSRTCNTRHVIVVAGPDCRDNPTIEGTFTRSPPTKEQENALYSCYYNSLLLASSEGKRSIAFPSISTGIFAFDKARAAAISSRAVYDFMRKNPNTTLRTISIHFYDSYIPPEKVNQAAAEEFAVYRKALGVTS